MKMIVNIDDGENRCFILSDDERITKCIVISDIDGGNTIGAQILNNSQIDLLIEALKEIRRND